MICSENIYYKYTETWLRKKLNETEKLEKEIKSQLEKVIQEKHLIKDAIIEKCREPSDELLEAIKEVESGQTTKYSSIEEMMRDLRQ